MFQFPAAETLFSPYYIKTLFGNVGFTPKRQVVLNREEKEACVVGIVAAYYGQDNVAYDWLSRLKQLYGSKFINALMHGWDDLPIYPNSGAAKAGYLLGQLLATEVMANETQEATAKG